MLWQSFHPWFRIRISFESPSHFGLSKIIMVFVGLLPRSGGPWCVGSASGSLRRYLRHRPWPTVNSFYWTHLTSRWYAAWRTRTDSVLSACWLTFTFLHFHFSKNTQRPSLGSLKNEQNKSWLILVSKLISLSPFVCRTLLFSEPASLSLEIS